MAAFSKNLSGDFITNSQMIAFHFNSIQFIFISIAPNYNSGSMCFKNWYTVANYNNWKGDIYSDIDEIIHLLQQHNLFPVYYHEVVL